MSSTLKKVLITTGIGLVLAFGLSALQGVFSAEDLKDTMRILSDGFFVVGMLILAYGGLVWTSNGGVWDGLVYSAKTVFGRSLKKNWEQEKQSFAEYREEREKKATSPAVPLLSGLVILVIAVVFLAVYSFQ